MWSWNASSRLLGQGSVLVDEADEGTEPRLLIYLEHAIRDGRAAKSGEAARRLAAAAIHPVEGGRLGRRRRAGPLSRLSADHSRRRRRRSPRCRLLRLGLRVRSSSARWAMRSPMLVPQHLAEVKQRRLAEIDKVEREVRARLTREINYWDARAARLREEERAGKEQRINAQNAEATAQRLADRLQKRQEELERERQISCAAAGAEGRGARYPEGACSHRRHRQPAQASRRASRTTRPRARRSRGSRWRR